MTDEHLRQRIGRQLNKGEQFHGLRRHLFYPNEADVRHRTPEQQTEQALCLTIVCKRDHRLGHGLHRARSRPAPRRRRGDRHEPREDEVRLDQPPEIPARPSQWVATRSGLQPGKQQRRRRPPVPQRRGEADQLVPVGVDQVVAELVLEQLSRVEGDGRAMAVELLSVEVTDSWSEPEAEEVVGAEDHLGVPVGVGRVLRDWQNCVVIEDPVQDVRRIADGRGDDLARALAVLIRGP